MGDLRNRIVELRYVKAGELIPNERNYRLHPAHQKRAYKALVDEIGFAGATLVYETDEGLKLIDGHMRAGIHGDDEIPVLVTDLNASEAGALLRMFDPLGAMAETAEDVLADLSAEVLGDFPDLEESLRVSAEAIGVELVEESGVVGDAPEAQVDRAEELNERWAVARGDLWIIPSVSGEGVHRLLCGDSTSEDDVALVMGGVKADLVFTDPPYGNDLGYGRGQLGERKIKNDVPEFLPKIPSILPPILSAKCHILIWVQWRTFSLIENLFSDYHLRTVCVWDKKTPSLSGGGFAEQHEWLCVFTHGKATQNEYMGNLWSVGRYVEGGGRNSHPTMKHVEACTPAIKNCSNINSIVFDPFGGSGTTMVACEQLARGCRMIEIEPKYCAVILERMVAMGCEPYRG